MRLRNWLLAGVAVAVVAGGAGAWAVNLFPRALDPIAAIDTSSFSADDIETGRNLALLGDCSACHTVPGAQGLSGGFPLPTPFGTIYSTNITPDVETGIGTWSLEAFDRAMRDGIDRAGNHLYPAFPYDHFAGITEPDMAALYAFLMSEPAVQAEAKANDLPFPFSMRPILAGWKFLFHSPAPFEPNPDFTDEENRGAYLAQTLGHCSACHSPRNALGAVEWSKGMAGGEAEGWLVPPLGEHSISPVAWDLDSYANYLFDGWSEQHAVAAGPMTPVVDHLFEADEDDVFAIAAWLARITPEVDQATRDAQFKAVAALDVPANFDGKVEGDGVTDLIQQGAAVFRDSCVKCHKDRTAENQPLSLGLTYAVNAHEPTNLFNAVLQGVAPSSGSPNRKMEPVQLPSEELAALAAFVRWQFTDLPAWEGLPAKAEAARSAMH